MVGQSLNYTNVMLDILAITWNVDPEIFHIGGLSIRYYSILFVSGFIIGWYIFRHFFKNEGIQVSPLLDYLLYTLLIATIVGARLGHCLFYQPDYYFGSWAGFAEIFMPWKGGLASHGGAIALIIAMIWFAHKFGRKNDFDFVWIMDRLAITVCFAGALIRLGNLFNSEIFGGPTDLPWGFRFPRSYEWVQLYGPSAEHPEGLACHPTQLYEALCYLILGIVLVLVYEKKLDKVHRGFFIGWFLIGCFGSRFLIEFIKNPQVEFEKNMLLDMGQWLSIPFILLGVGFLVYAAVRKLPARAVHPETPKSQPTHYAKPVAK